VRRRRLEVLAVNGALVAGALVTLAPLLWMVSASFMQPGEANTVPPPLWPRQPTLANYAALFTRLDMLRHFLASALVSVLATVASVLVNSLAGYAFAKLPFRGRDRLFGGLATALVVPAQVSMLPLFLLLRELGLVNTYAPTPPSAPSGLTAARATGFAYLNIDLAWADNSGDESGFRIERKLPGESEFMVRRTLNVENATNSMTHTDNTRTCGTTFDYQVRAFNKAGKSEESNIASVWF